jgi:hypothetical protein
VIVPEQRSKADRSTPPTENFRASLRSVLSSGGARKLYSARIEAMIRRMSRRDIVKVTAKVAAIGAVGVGRPAIARAGTPSNIDALLRAATSAGELPGIVALAATENGTTSSMRACSAGAVCPKARP